MSHSNVASPPSRRARIAFALIVAALSAAYVIAFAATNPDFTSDFDQVWGAARALTAAQNPYDVVGPGKLYPWAWPLYYPLPAVLIAIPLAALPVVAARAAFAALSSALFTYAITRDSFARAPVFLSISFVTAVELVQWSPLLTAAMLLPGLGWLAVAKPNLGFAMIAHSPSNRALAITAGGITLLLLASFAVQPGWVLEWLSNVRSAPQFRPLIAGPLGLLLLPALLRWRRPEARFLAALAFVPRTPTFYDHVFVFVAAVTFRESLLLTIGTFGVFFFLAFNTPFPNLTARMELLTQASVLMVYVPAVVMVLRRPNTGEVPAIVNEAASRVRALLRRATGVLRQ